MPKYHLRSWAEQTLLACRDYTVTADTLEAACELMRDQQQEADENDGPIEHPAITTLDEGRLSGIVMLDPKEVVDGASGITLIDEEGERVRDLIGVPTTCVQLGEPLDI